jgi:hypothetical protein
MKIYLSTRRRITPKGLDTALVKINRLATAGTVMRPVKFIGENLHLFATVRAFAGKRFQVT